MTQFLFFLRVYGQHFICYCRDNSHNENEYIAVSETGKLSLVTVKYSKDSNTNDERIGNGLQKPAQTKTSSPSPT